MFSIKQNFQGKILHLYMKFSTYFTKYFVLLFFVKRDKGYAAY